MDEVNIDWTYKPEKKRAPVGTQFENEEIRKY
jgi:hypothetical protein